MFKKRVTLEQKKSFFGLLFLLPLGTGIMMFFVYPIVNSFIISLSTLEMTAQGYVLNFVGIANYREALMVNPEFRQNVVTAIINMIANVPLIILFSFFIATLLNQKFFGRTLVRSIFFLPIIITSAALLAIDRHDILQREMGAGGAFKSSNAISSGFQSIQLATEFVKLGLKEELSRIIADTVDRIYDIASLSGVQILIFLAALQSIPRSLYEASQIEGASSWEIFWKISFPIISPHIVTCVVYSIIDSFTSYNNETLSFVHGIAFKIHRYGLSSAMGWIYFVIIFIILAVTVKIISKKVFYYDK